MLAFGRDQMLPRDEILNVTAYVQSLSDPTVATGQHAEAVRAGQETFAANVSRVTARMGKGAPNSAPRTSRTGSGSMAATGSRSSRRFTMAGRDTCLTGSSA